MANKISYEGFQPDSIVQSINEKLVGRAEVGFNKYGATMDRDDLSEVEWITHAQEELLDMLLYMEKLKVELEKIVNPEANNTNLDQHQPGTVVLCNQ